jgi:hypothetical protein
LAIRLFILDNDNVFLLQLISPFLYCFFLFL